jgi:hypothetical protein
MPIEPTPDDRADAMAADPRRYFDAAWERTEREVLAERSARPPRRGHFREQRYAKPAPGVVQLRVTASSDDDIQRFLARLAEAGIRVWSANQKLYRHDDGAVCRYVSVAPEEGTA